MGNLASEVESRLGACHVCGKIKILTNHMCKECEVVYRLHEKEEIQQGIRCSMGEANIFRYITKVHADYKSLYHVLTEALNQAQSGKGKERHAAGEPFDQQEICQNTRAVGLGYPLGQARKKARESLRLLEDRGTEAAVAECLGAINYLAAAIIVMREE